MSRATTAAAVLGVVAMAGGAPACAQPPVGIVRPSDESNLTPRQLGAQLYAGNCASCHGIDGRGVSPPRPGAGAGAILAAGPSARVPRTSI